MNNSFSLLVAERNSVFGSIFYIFSKTNNKYMHLVRGPIQPALLGLNFGNPCIDSQNIWWKMWQKFSKSAALIGLIIFNFYLLTSLSTIHKLKFFVQFRSKFSKHICNLDCCNQCNLVIYVMPMKNISTCTDSECGYYFYYFYA